MRITVTVVMVLVLLLVVFDTDASSLISNQVELCGPETDIHLGEDRESSSAIILLEPSDQLEVCKLRISAPPTHVIYLSFMETASELHREFMAEHSPPDRPCTLSVFLKENRSTPVWKGDPCSNDPLPNIDLLNPQLRLVWLPPDNQFHTKGRRLIVTAVGQGETCNKIGYHTCMSIGHKPLFCVSTNLVCDGHRNCPKGATKSDEDEKICTFPLSSLLPDKFALELLKHLKPSHIVNTQFLNTLLRSTEAPSVRYPWKHWKQVQTSDNTIIATTQRPVEEKRTTAIESFSLALSHYGPWGYIMLGMLICGTVLMFCGIWECLKRPKTTSESTQPQPTTVLIINNQQEENQPPHYDDIDPPSYMTLFPNFKLDAIPTAETSDVNGANQQLGGADHQQQQQSENESTNEEGSPTQSTDNVNASSNANTNNASSDVSNDASSSSTNGTDGET